MPQTRKRKVTCFQLDKLCFLHFIIAGLEIKSRDLRKSVTEFIFWASFVFSEDIFSKAFGNKIGEYDTSWTDLSGLAASHPLEVYQKHIEENDCTLITLKLVDSYEYLSGAFLVEYYINDKEMLGVKNFSYAGSYVGAYGKIMCLVYDTPENIRKGNEISDDEPLEVYISLKAYDGDNRVTDLTIPVTLE